MDERNFIDDSDPAAMWGYLLVAEETFQSKMGEQLLLTEGGGEVLNGLKLFF